MTLARDLERALSDQGIALRVTSVAPLTGGASRATSAVAAERDDGSTWNLILQSEPGERRHPEGMALEAEIITAAGTAGVPVASVVATHPAAEPENPDALGSSWFLSEAVEGETIARRILRDEAFAGARAVLPAQLGAALAATHTAALDGLEGLERQDELVRYREVADELGLVSPAFELAFRWLERHRPTATTETLVHGDFRLGNLIIDASGLSAVIDWELAHIGDPMEDLGWLCVRAWRFGGPKPVAGLGDYDELFAAYEQASGRAVDPEVVRWWEVLGTLKWGIMCGMQAERHRSGATRSVELAAIGRRIPEQEFDLMMLLGAREPGPADDGPEPSPSAASAETSTLDLIDAVREFIQNDVMTGDNPRVAFHGRVAANVLAMVERDLTLGPDQDTAHRARLEGLGVPSITSDDELAAAIRRGELDDRTIEVRDILAARAADRLAVNNPRWLPPG